MRPTTDGATRASACAVLSLSGDSPAHAFNGELAKDIATCAVLHTAPAIGPTLNRLTCSQLPIKQRVLAPTVLHTASDIGSTRVQPIMGQLTIIAIGLLLTQINGFHHSCQGKDMCSLRVLHCFVCFGSLGSDQPRVCLSDSSSWAMLLSYRHVACSSASIELCL